MTTQYTAKSLMLTPKITLPNIVAIGSQILIGLFFVPTSSRKCTSFLWRVLRHEQTSRSGRRGGIGSMAKPAYTVQIEGD